MSFLIKPAWLFDGESFQERPTLKLNSPPVQDLSNCGILPGLIDAHVHLALPQALQNPAEPAELLASAQHNAAQILACGITGVRDGGDLQEIGLQLSRQNSSPLFIQSGGAALRRPSLYGSFLGAGINSENWPELIRSYRQKGAGHLKILVSGITSFQEYGKTGALQFSPEELNYLVQLARQEGLGVMAHASSDPAVKIAVQAGVQSIEHGYLISPATLGQMADQQITWVPTLAAVANQLKETDKFTPQQREVIRRLLKGQLASLNLAAQIGVPLAVGTDSGSASVRHGQDYLTELQLYQKAGLSIPQILKAATTGGAKLLPHYPADSWLAVPSNLRENLEALTQIKASLKNFSGELL